MRQTDGVIDHQ